MTYTAQVGASGFDRPEMFTGQDGRQIRLFSVLEIMVQLAQPHSLTQIQEAGVYKWVQVIYGSVEMDMMETLIVLMVIKLKF